MSYKKEDYGVIIQARMNSSRLPGKVLMPIYNNKNSIEIILENLSYLNPIVATTTNSSDNLIEKFVKSKGFDCYRGEENDVLKRFIDCATKFNFNKIVRVCADNPFIDSELCNILISNDLSSNFDYTSFCFNNIPGIKLDHGIYTEIVTLKALKKAYSRNLKSDDLEHVTKYIYESKLFKCNFLEIEKYIFKKHMFRLTLDTELDYLKLKKISKIFSPINFSIYDYQIAISKNKKLFQLNEKGKVK